MQRLECHVVWRDKAMPCGRWRQNKRGCDRHALHLGCACIMLEEHFLCTASCELWHTDSKTTISWYVALAQEKSECRSWSCALKELYTLLAEATATTSSPPHRPSHECSIPSSEFKLKTADTCYNLRLPARLISKRARLASMSQLQTGPAALAHHPAVVSSNPVVLPRPASLLTDAAHCN